MYCQPNHGGPTAAHSRTYATTGKAAACHSFDYYFPNAPEQTADPKHLAALDALGLAMIEQDPINGANAALPAVLTYFGQFIDHDITAGTDRDGADEQIDDPDLAPRKRSDVRGQKKNMRSGRLDLDSLYGGLPNGIAQDPADQAFLKKLEQAMRSQTFLGQMRVAFYDADTPDTGVPFPPDRAGDVLRLGALMGGSAPLITPAEIAGLSSGLQKMFTKADQSEPNPTRAIIGDGRNDENLIVAQFHLVFLRLHNRLVQNRPAEIPRTEAFEWARQRTRWIYQWLVVNYYLRELCPADLLDSFLSAGPGLYNSFRTASGCDDDVLPLPIEFSAAAFRFGHSMVRDAYDWNTFFGTETTHTPLLPNAPFNLLFAFTGGGELGRRGTDQLPANWGADWRRMIFGANGIDPSETARKIDTHLALELAKLPDGTVNSVLADLARRNLRRGHLLNLPSAQVAAHELGIVALTASELGSGDLGDVLKDGDLLEETPLWYYVLREAEVRENGERLGPLGATLVAQTLLGLVVNDDKSYWHQRGNDPDGRWSPADLSIDGLPDLSSLEAVMKFTDLM